jgi:hypothetical protein
MRKLTCARCGQRVFFENTRCESCSAALGFVPMELTMAAFEVAAGGEWQRHGVGDSAESAQWPCANYLNEQVCNWMVPAGSEETLCLSCRSTEMLPPLDVAPNRERWAALEQAKRRLFYGLLAMGLPLDGLSFRFLADLPDGAPEAHPLTGHNHGVVTINVAEADDSTREATRAQMNESYRTLLGHFRHEAGHFYWEKLIDGTSWLEEFRQQFGDEQSDYQQALQQHYNAPVVDWWQRFISAYASSHPWEDWAECWAHYMHLHDGLETAAAWGLRLAGVEPQPLDPDEPLQRPLIEEWLPVSQFVNAMDRSLGTADSYPFVVPPPVVEKLQFIHRVIAAQPPP